MKKLISFLFIIPFIILSANAQTDVFNDVYEEHINIEAIQYLKTNDVVEGYEDGNYKPENRINRAELIKIIVASQVESPTGSYCFTDVKNEWFAKYICTAKRLGYIKGYADGTFKPANYINFAESSKIITKALEVAEDKTGTNQEWFAGYVKGLENRKAIPTTVQFFDKEISRGDMSEVIWRLKENRTDKISNTYSEITSEFPTIQSCGALREKFMEYQSYSAPSYMREEEVFMMDTTAVPKAAESSEAAAGGGADDFSQTNVQVSGVDEADIIKNDGEYIYMLKDQTVRIIKAYPPNAMTEVAEINYEGDTFYPSEMFINDDKLVIIGRDSNYYFYDDIESLIYPPHPYRSSQTKVYIYDITDRSDPDEIRVVRFDGSYNTSRRIEDNLYLVMNAHPNVWLMEDVNTGEELIPRMQDGDSEPEPMVSCVDIRYFPGFHVPRYLIIASVPIASTGEIDKEIFLGSSENVYSSRTHMYVATSAINYDRYTDWDWRRDRAKTHIYRFSLEDGDITYKARGEVSGKILNQFSMDAYRDHFRIATTKGNMWDEENPSTNNVYVLDTEMKTVGSLEDLAPGERIYSTRFMGDRLYMVTFRQVDPLFVIDLSSPTNPTVLGKLKIPGFSNYLHPFDEDHIIGFGKDTEESDFGGTLMQGMKIGLFDVSDVSNPKEKFVEIIGDRGTDSELLQNHKALLFDKDKELLAFPVRIIEKIAPEDMECSKYRYSTCPDYCYSRCIPSDCTEETDGTAVCTDDCEGLGSCYDPSYEQYETTFSGAVVYNLNLTDGFTQKGRITHYSDDDILQMGNYWPYDWDKQIQRIIYIGDYLYSISQDMIKGSTIDTVEEVNSLTID
jgi:uncharacterized secreted protein with C-terminal beta-propeller domain